MTKDQGKPGTASFTYNIRIFLLATAHMLMLQGKLAVASFPIENNKNLFKFTFPKDS